MPNFLRSIFIWICGVIFQLIPPLYRLFYDLAGATFFQQDVIKTFSRNLYILLSVVMLFAFAIKALESIVNPDLLFDSKKGFTGVIKRSVIALLLIIVIPFAFDKFYEYQNEIMSKSLIEKMILGVNIEDSEGENMAGATGAGQMMAGLTLQSVLYLNDDSVVYEDMDTTIEAYNAAVSEDIGEIFKFAPDINEKYGDGDDEYIFEFHWLIAIIGGVFIIITLFTFCLDTAERVIRMGFLQLTAPISVIAYVYGGNSVLSNWASETAKSAFSVFIRIAGLAFLIFVLSSVQDFASGVTSENGVYRALIIVLIIVGALMFIKEVPKTIEKIFGISMGNKGGIRGRLGNMAGADVAKKSLSALGKTAAIGGAAVLGGAAALGGAIGGAISNSEKMQAARQKGREIASNIKSSVSNSKVGQTVSGAVSKIANSKPGQAVGSTVSSMAASAGRNARVAKAATSADGNIIKKLGAGVDAYKNDIVTQRNSGLHGVERANNLGFDQNDRVIRADDTDPNKNVNARNVATNLKNNIKDNNNFNSYQSDALQNLIDAKNKKAAVDKVSSSIEKVDSFLEDQKNIALQKGDISTANTLETLLSQRKSGNISMSDLQSRLLNMGSNNLINAASTNAILGTIDGITNTIANDSNLKANFTDGTVSQAKLNVEKTASENDVNNANKVVEREFTGAKDKVQKEKEFYESKTDNLASSYATEISKDGQSSARIQTGGYNTSSENSSSYDSQGGSTSNQNATSSSSSQSTGYGQHTEHTTSQQDAYRQMGPNTINQNIDFSGLENTLKRNTDEINNNINNRTSEIKNDIGNTRDDINKNLKKVNDNVVNNINKATSDISENVKKQIEQMPSLNDFFSDDNNDSNLE